MPTPFSKPPANEEPHADAFSFAPPSMQGPLNLAWAGLEYRLPRYGLDASPMHKMLFASDPSAP